MSNDPDSRRRWWEDAVAEAAAAGMREAAAGGTDGPPQTVESILSGLRRGGDDDEAFRAERRVAASALRAARDAILGEVCAAKARLAPEGISVGPVVVGGSAPPLYVAGPSGVGDARSMQEVADRMRRMDVSILRSDPWDVSGPCAYCAESSAQKGLNILSSVARYSGLASMAPVHDASYAASAAKLLDAVQVDVRDLGNYPLLRAVARACGERGTACFVGINPGVSLASWNEVVGFLRDNGCPQVACVDQSMRTARALPIPTMCSVMACGYPCMVDVACTTWAPRSVLLSSAFAAGASAVAVTVSAPWGKGEDGAWTPDELHGAAAAAALAVARAPRVA